LKVKDLLLPYSEIVWNKDDIQAGVKTVRGVEYNLVELMGLYNTVIEYVYIYTGESRVEFCHVDFGCDSVVKKPAQILYEYYKDNKYKIFKSYKWYLKDEYRGEFAEVIKSIERINGLLNRIELFRNVSRFKVLKEEDRKYLLKDCIKESKIEGFVFTEENMDVIVKKLSKKIERVSRDQIPIFRKKLKERFEPMLVSYEMKTKIAERCISREELEKNIEYGFKCPFFTILNEDFSYTYNICKRTGLDYEKMIECVRKVSESFEIPITLVVNSIFAKNEWRVEKSGKYFVVMDGVKMLKRFSKVNDAQKYVLTGI
jgi:hypothetical protein